MDPEQTAQEQSDLGPHFCHRGFLNVSADEKSRRLLMRNWRIKGKLSLDV